jgi:L-iditol 2-dehydrogenase
MDASFGTTTLAMSKAIRLMETGVIDVEPIITHRFPLTRIHNAVEAMAGSERTKVIVKP